MLFPINLKSFIQINDKMLKKKIDHNIDQNLKKIFWKFLTQQVKDEIIHNHCLL